MRLVDADKLKEDVLDLPNCPNEFSDTYDKARILDLVDEQPAVDAEPVKHGHWEVVDGTEPRRYGCSVCKRLSWTEDNYCSYCGAKMDEVEDI